MSTVISSYLSVEISALGQHFNMETKLILMSHSTTEDISI